MSFSQKDRDEINQNDSSQGLDEANFENFFKTLQPGLCIYCKLKYKFEIEQAQDIVNAAFIKIWEVRHTLSMDASPRSYLYKIVDNLSLNLLKHEKVRLRHVQYVLQTIPEGSLYNSFDSIDMKQLREDIDAAISDLPGQMRRIFELSRFEGLKYAEIADQLNISVKTVENQMSRALERLRAKLARYITLFLVVLAFIFLIKK